MKYLWSLIVLIGLFLCVFVGNSVNALQSLLDGINSGLHLCVSLAAGCMLFMGFSEVAKAAGLLEKLSSSVGPIIEALFGIPRRSKAASSISLNLSANMMGLGNAATPFGLQAMKELYALNPSETASAAMCMLLCVNISSVQVIPVNVIALRSQFGSVNPADIMLPSLVSTAATTFVAIILCRVLEKK